ncbi:MAG: hypothetical protein AB8G77_17435 [Rhodothermales bacterium]
MDPIRVNPDSFEPQNHFYPRVLNAQIHPMVAHFFEMGTARIVERYTHLHPEVDTKKIQEILTHMTKYFRWGGADLFSATTSTGIRKIIVIETNSCPSGMKSMPFGSDPYVQSGYRSVIEQTFLPMLKRRKLPKGDLAVLYDKNLMETSGYAAMLAELSGEPVWLVPFHHTDPNPPARFTEDGILEIRTAVDEWRPIRAAFRYVTQRPWNRIPPTTRTAILNPVLVCLAGGRNKLLAAKAYDLHNALLRGTGLSIRTPETIWDVSKNEIPLWVQRMGGIAVIKDPYSNAGQGVFTITNSEELDHFMTLSFRYDRFIVQSLVGNSDWSSQMTQGRFYHLGTIPNRKGAIYAADMRFMVGVDHNGFYPLAIYARRANKPLMAQLDGSVPSWEMLGTNLSVKKDDGSWDTETNRLLLMDGRDFNKLGVGLDDLIEGYIQTILSVTAIDEMAKQLVTQKGMFRRRLFRSLNPDPSLVDDIIA